MLRKYETSRERERTIEWGKGMRGAGVLQAAGMLSYRKPLDTHTHTK